MIQKLNWENRIPTNVLSNNAVRYGIYDENGNLLRYEYIKKEDEPVEEGTRINKLQGDKIDDNIDELIGERSRVDRYNIPTVSVVEGINLNDIIPKSWTISDLNNYYTNSDDTVKLYYSRRINDYTPPLACDGYISSYWSSGSGSTHEYLKLYFTTAVKITKMKIHIKASLSSYLSNWKIQGSNDNTNWTDLYTSENETVDLTEIVLTNTNYYNYYRLYVTKTSTSGYVYIYEWQVSESYGDVNVLTLNNNIDNYFNNQIVLLDISDNSIDITKTFYININSLGNKLISGINSLGKYELIYDGTKFIASKNVEIVELLKINENYFGSNTYTISDLNTYYDKIKINGRIYAGNRSKCTINGTRLYGWNSALGSSTTVGTPISYASSSDVFNYHNSNSHWRHIFYCEIDLRRKTYLIITSSTAYGCVIEQGLYTSLTDITFNIGYTGVESEVNISVIGEKVLLNEKNI